MSEHQEDNGTPRKETLGNLFQRTRRSQHKTLEQAAEATRIHLNALEALETDNFDRLPAEVFTRGFIKLYAQYLGLDAEETLKHYISQENVDPDKPADRPYRRDILDGEAMAHAPALFKGNRRVLTLILLFAVLIGFYILGKIYKPMVPPVGESGPDNQISLSLNEEQTDPETRVMPPTEEGSPATKPVENDLKVLEPRVPTPKIPTPDGEPEGSAYAPKSESQADSIQPAQPKPGRSVQVDAKPLSAVEPAADIAPSATGPTSREVGTKPAQSPSTVAPAKTGSPGSRSFVPVTVNVATAPVDAAEDETKAPAAATGPYNYILEANFRASSWIHVEVDDQPVREYTSQADVTRVWRASHSMLLKLDHPEAVDLILNGKPLAVTTNPGEAAIIRIPPDSP